MTKPIGPATIIDTTSPLKPALPVTGATTFSGPAPHPDTVVHAGGVDLSASIGPSVGLSATRFSATAPEVLPPDHFIDPSLNLLFPTLSELKSNPIIKLPNTDAGLRVSYRGALETWSGPTDSIAAAVRYRDTDNTLKSYEIGRIARMDAGAAVESLQTAVTSYRDGFGAWASMDLSERAEVLAKALDEIQGRRDEIINLLMWEVGKNKKDAEKEFDRTMEYMRVTIADAHELAKRQNTVQEEPTVKQISRTVYSPYGVVLASGPSNYPWNEGFGTSVFPALIMGNAIVYKDPKFGLLPLRTVLDILSKYLPAGTLNVISGDGKEVIPPVMKTGEVDLLYFIGSTGAAKAITGQHPDHTELRSVLALSAKNVVLALESATAEQIAKMAYETAFGNRGERCTAGSVVCVPEQLAAEVSRLVAQMVEKRTIGMPWDNADDTPFADSGKIEWIEKNLLRDAITKGAQIVNAKGGTHNGFIMRPAVLYPVRPGMNVVDNDVFSPVLGIMPYSNLTDATGYIGDLYSEQQLGIVAADGDINAFAIAAAFDGKMREVKVNKIPKRDDSEQDKGFGARHEIPLGRLPALEAASVKGYIAAADTPANREVLDKLDYKELKKLGSMKIRGASTSSDANADSGGGDGEEQSGHQK